MNEPIFIVIDSADGAGKSTLIKNIVDRWEGDIDSYFDPGISHHPAFEKWQIIRNFVKTQGMEDETETLLFFAMRKELEAQIIHSLGHGRDALVDRFHVSTYIYQGKLKGQTEFIERLETVINFKKPDLTFILNAPFDVLTKRLEKRASNIDKFKSNTDFRKRVWEAYQNYIHEHKDVVVVDASGTEEDTYKRCMEVISAYKR